MPPRDLFWLHRQCISTEQVFHVGMYAYLDESGKFHDGAGFVCLCAWLSHDQKGWTKHRDEWVRLAQKYKVRRIHMTQWDSELPTGMDARAS